MKKVTGPGLLFILYLFTTTACDGIFRGNSGTLMSEDTTLSLVVREWSKRIEKYPDNHEYYIGRAQELVKDAKFQLALADVEKALELHNMDPTYYALKGDVHMALNQSFEASKTYEQAVNKFPRDLQSVINLGRFQMIVRKYDESMQTLNKALELSPNSVEALFFQGMVYKESGDTSNAIQTFERCALYDPSNTDVMMQLGQLFTARTDSAGLLWFSRAIDQDPLNDEAFYGRGFLYQKLLRDTEALRDYQQAVDLNASHYLAYYNTGYILFARKNWDRAIEHFRIAVKFAPDFVKGHYMLGLCNEGKQNPEQAFVHYRRCLDLNPDYAPALQGLKRLEINQ